MNNFLKYPQFKGVQNIPTDRFIETKYFAKKYGYYNEDTDTINFPEHSNHSAAYYMANPGCPIGAEFISEVWKKMLENKDIVYDKDEGVFHKDIRPMKDLIYPNFDDTTIPHYGLAEIAENDYVLYEKDRSIYGDACPGVLWDDVVEFSYGFPEKMPGESSMFKRCLLYMTFVPYYDVTIIERPVLNLSIDYTEDTEGICTIEYEGSDGVNIPVKKGTLVICRYSKEINDFDFELIDLTNYTR